MTDNAIAKATEKVRHRAVSASTRSMQTAMPDGSGAERGSPASEQLAHAERLRASPVPYRAVLARDGTGQVVAGGQVAVELELAGLYDVFTPPASRGRGHARVLCRHLLDVAAGDGAAWAYLQVEASNVAARRIYTRLGFADAYAYHYRAPPSF